MLNIFYWDKIKEIYNHMINRINWINRTNRINWINWINWIIRIRIRITNHVKWYKCYKEKCYSYKIIIIIEKDRRQKQQGN